MRIRRPGQRSARAVARLSFAYAATDSRETALQLVEELGTRSKTEAISAHTFATACAGIADREQALHSLETAARDRDRDILSMRFDPLFVALRDEPRYQAIVEQFGIPH